MNQLQGSSPPPPPLKLQLLLSTYRDIQRFPQIYFMFKPELHQGSQPLPSGTGQSSYQACWETCTYIQGQNLIARGRVPLENSKQRECQLSVSATVQKEAVSIEGSEIRSWGSFIQGLGISCMGFRLQVISLDITLAAQWFP